MATYIALIVAVLGAGGAGALIQTRAMNRRTNAEAHKVDAETEVTLGAGWAALYAAQQGEIAGMRERVALVEHRAQAAEDREAECLRRLDEIEDHARSSLVEVEAKVLALLDQEITKRGSI